MCVLTRFGFALQVRGDIGDEMFFIQDGTVDVRRAQSPPGHCEEKKLAAWQTIHNVPLREPDTF